MNAVTKINMQCAELTKLKVELALLKDVHTQTEKYMAQLLKTSTPCIELFKKATYDARSRCFIIPVDLVVHDAPQLLLENKGFLKYA